MTTTTQKYKLIDREQLKAKIDKKEQFTLWNTLGKDYYRSEANIPGSQWVPVENIVAKIKETGLAKDAVIITYCGGPRCPSSKQAAEKLSSLGFSDVGAYEGGLQDWTEGGLPLVKL